MKYPSWALTDRCFALVGVFQLLGIAGIVSRPFLIAYLVSWLVWPLLLLYDRWRMPSAAAFAVDLEIPRSLEIGHAYRFALTVTIANRRSLRLSRFSLLAPDRPNVEFTQSSFDIDLPRLAPGEHRFRGHLPARAMRLGYEVIDSFTLRLRSPLGFWARHLQHAPSPLAYRVMPVNRIVPAERFQEIINQQRIFQQGSRRVLQGQNPEQFLTVRKYQYPDPLRFLDAKKTAKYGTPMTKTFESYFNHHLVIGLDLGRSMLGHLGVSKKADYYLSAALALAESALHARDRVSFFAFSQKVHRLIVNSRNAGDFASLYRGSAELGPVNVEPNYDLVLPSVQRCSGSRAIFVLLTDASRPSVQSSLARVLREVSSRHLTVVCSLVDEDFSLEAALRREAPAKTTPDAALADFNHRVYQYWLEDRMRHFRMDVNGQGAGAVSATDAEWLNVVNRVYRRLRESLSA